MDIWKVKFDTEQIAEFQRCVLEEIGAESPVTQNRILERLKKVFAAKIGIAWTLE